MMLSHMVYFTLKDSSAEACQKLVDACHRYLTQHDGIKFFAAGTRETDYQRPVNQIFDVALHVVFEDRAAHDVYQTSDNHMAFIEEGKDNWEKVCVFDANVS